MKKIINWLFGSFFRTIGKVIAFLLLGLILFYVFNSNGTLKNIDLFSILGIRVNAAEDIIYNIKFDNTTLTTQNFLIPSGVENHSFRINNDNSNDMIYFLPYRILSVCNTGDINNVSTSNSSVKDLQLIKTEQPCNLNNTPNYKGKKTFITYTLDMSKFDTSGSGFSCSLTGSNCIENISILSYWNVGGYVQLINVWSSDTPFNYDSSQDVLISQNGTIIDQNSEIINKQDTIIYQNTQLNNSVNDINDTLTDDDTTQSTNEASNFFSGFSTDTHGLTGVITAPLSAIQSLTSKTCSPLVLPIPFLDNKNLTLPCMRTVYMEFFGDFMNIYDVICIGVVSYWIMVRIFNLVKDFKNPDHDEIEVLDL